MIIDNVKFFWVDGFTEDKYVVNSQYKQEVLDKDKSVLYASLKWLKETEAIDDIDIEAFSDVKNYRNQLTHEMLDTLFTENNEVFEVYYTKLIYLIIKIDRWWVLNIEIPTNCIDNIDQIKEEEVISSSEILIKLLTDLIAGDEETSTMYYNEYLKYKAKYPHVT